MPDAHPLFHTLAQTVVDGVAIGSLYALIALGYTLVFGVLQFINFAHGDVFALGAWTALVIASWFAKKVADHPWLDSAVVTVILVPVAVIVACSAVGFVIEQFAYRPLRSAPRLNVLITAIGVSLLLENVGQLPFAFGTQPTQVPQLVRTGVADPATGALIDTTAWHLGGVAFRKLDRVLFVTAAVLMAGLQWLIYRTKFGTAMRAVSFNPKAAALMGINVDAVISRTFVLGSALAGAAGYLYAMKFQTQTLKQTADATWVLLGMKAFVAAVVGGIGNVRGAMLGGLLIGVVEKLGTAAGLLMFQAHWTGAVWATSQYSDVYVFLVLIGVLLVRPAGLLGKATVEKV